MRLPASAIIRRPTLRALRHFSSKVGWYADCLLCFIDGKEGERKMTRKHRPKFSQLLLVVMLGTVMITALPRHGHAYSDGGAALGALAIFAVGTFITALSLVCLPVAAVKTTQDEESFGAAFGTCLKGGESGGPSDKELAANAADDTTNNQEPIAKVRGEFYDAGGREDFEDRYLGD